MNMKHSRKQLLESVSTLKKANESIRDGKISDVNMIIDVLTQSQELAITIGNSLEEMEEDTSDIITTLEEYCENLYQLSLVPEDGTVRNKLTKKIRVQLGKIETGIYSTIQEDKKEIVFLPYKASMWDSLESVWLAAKEDKNCNAFVVPIPYYDKNPDGSFGTMHYEGDQYPNYVPITSWQEYNIKERRPDVIYIHNPYDGWNHVTSVHPEFYAKILKDYTDQLVYIPYFVLEEIEPNDQNRIDGMKHFCFLPGIIYSDRVVVQSQNMRQIYINEYLKVADENGFAVNKKAVEQKFLGLGSPKIDKVLNTDKKDIVIPEEWLKIIVKEDGSWKKIVFYNISIGSLLFFNEKMLLKLKNVLSTFRENKDEVALLWRSHPLLRNTIKSMRPQLEEEYDKIVMQYRNEGWGIYDETPDMNRALFICDAYYGTDSSIVQLVQKAGKPIMRQDENLIVERGVNKGDGF